MKPSLISLLISLFAWGLGVYVFFFPKDAETYIFPKVIIIFFIAFSTGIVIKELFSPSPKEKGATNKLIASIKKSKKIHWPEIILIGIILFYTSLLDSLGMLLTSFLVFFSIGVYYNRVKFKNLTLKNWITVILVSFLFTGILYWIFVEILEVQFPQGIFEASESNEEEF